MLPTFDQLARPNPALALVRYFSRIPLEELRDLVVINLGAIRYHLARARRFPDDRRFVELHKARDLANELKVMRADIARRCTPEN